MAHTTLFKWRVYVYLFLHRHMAEQQNAKPPSATKVKSQMRRGSRQSISFMRAAELFFVLLKSA
eukprot:4725449-Ditylum_brightwellii.AAC.1